MPHTRGLRFTAHCICGDSIDARTAHADTIRFLGSMWDKLHRGDGHGVATPSQAGRIRARQRASELAEAARSGAP